VITPQSIQQFVKAEPFRPLQIRTASGRTFEVRHPEMIKVKRSNILPFQAEEDPEIPDSFEMVSLMLTESVAPIESKANRGVEPS
jgi:hypothetical protein